MFSTLSDSNPGKSGNLVSVYGCIVSFIKKKNLKASLNERLRIILLRFKRKTRQAKDHRGEKGWQVDVGKVSSL